MRYWLIVVAAAGLPLSRSICQAAPSPAPTPVWTLVEDLRIGGADTGSKSFSDIRGAVATKAGTIFVLDYKAQKIRVFDDKGAFLRVAADSGSGPGDILAGNGLAVGPDDAVWVNDPRNHRFSLYRPNGQFLRQIPNASPSSTPVWQGVIDQTGRAIDLPITVVTTRSDPATGLPIAQSGVRFIHPDGKADSVSYPICDETGSALSPFFQFQRADGQGNMIRAIPFLPKQLVVLTRQGRAWCTPSSSYRLMTGLVGGPLKEVVNLDMPPIPIPPELRQQAVDRVDSIVKSYGPLMAGGNTDMIPRNEPFIASLHADDEGRVWVRRTNASDALPFFDVFDATGHVVAAVHGVGLIGAQVFIAGNELLTVSRSVTGAQVVVRYHINRP